MIRHTPRFTRTDTLFPYTTLFRSILGRVLHVEAAVERRHQRTAGVVEVILLRPETARIDIACRYAADMGDDRDILVYRRKAVGGRREHRPLVLVDDATDEVLVVDERSDGRRLGKECVRTCRSGW